jgi:Flp pilus assembly protein TadG
MEAGSYGGAGNFACSRLLGGPVRIVQLREPAGRPAGGRIAHPTAGQALVEFAMAALITLLLVLGVVEFSRIMLVYTTLADAARLGARYAITHGTPPGNSVPTQSDIQSGVQAVVEKFLAPGTVDINTVVITTSFPPSGATTPGNRVLVDLYYPYNFLVLPIHQLSLSLVTNSEGIITW